MAKNIDFMGATFPDVPSIRLPQQGGGLASFDDTSDGDIQPADVALGKIGYSQGQRVVGTAVAPTGSQTFTENGTFDVTALAEAVINVAGGGGGEKNIQVYDGYAYVQTQYYSKTAVKITVKKTGTYRVSWMGFRNGNNTNFRSRAYVNETAAGIEHNTFLVNYGAYAYDTLQLNENDELAIYARVGGSGLSMYVGNLIIQEQ